MRTKLTAASISDLSLSDGNLEDIVWDTELNGFGLRLRLGGSRRWVFRYSLGGKELKMTLGAATQESFKTAKGPGGVVLKLGIREQVAHLIARVGLGQDPAADKLEARRKAAETFKEVSTKFLEQKRLALRPGSYRQVDRHITIHAKDLEKDGLSNIKRRQLSDLLDGVMKRSGVVTANRTYSTLSEFFAWSMGKGYIDANPMLGIPKFEGEKQRDRVLDDRELRLIWEACDPSDHYGAIVRLLILTGQRANEIAGLRLSEIKTEKSQIELPSARTKNKTSHIVPLSGPAMAILNGLIRRANKDGTLRDLVFGVAEGTAFSGWSRCKERLDQRVTELNGGPLPDWVVHDLRRSVATGLGNLEAQPQPPRVIEALLNHKSGVKAGVSGLYNRSGYEREKRRAVELWANHLMAVVDGCTGNVVPLQRA
jgi:integrase